jgi:hypothetical protein
VMEVDRLGDGLICIRVVVYPELAVAVEFHGRDAWSMMLVKTVPWG